MKTGRGARPLRDHAHQVRSLTPASWAACLQVSSSGTMAGLFAPSGCVSWGWGDCIFVVLVIGHPISGTSANRPPFVSQDLRNAVKVVFGNKPPARHDGAQIVP